MEATLAAFDDQLVHFEGDDFVDVPAQMVALTYVTPVANLSAPLADGLEQPPMPLLLSEERFGLEAAIDPGQLDAIRYSRKVGYLSVQAATNAPTAAAPSPIAPA